MGNDLPGMRGGFAMVLALGVPFTAAVAIVIMYRPWRTALMLAAVFGVTVVSLLAAWWLLWPALLWLSRSRGRLP